MKPNDQMVNSRPAGPASAQEASYPWGVPSRRGSFINLYFSRTDSYDRIVTEGVRPRTSRGAEYDAAELLRRSCQAGEGEAARLLAVTRLHEAIEGRDEATAVWIAACTRLGVRTAGPLLEEVLRSSWSDQVVLAAIDAARVLVRDDLEKGRLEPKLLSIADDRVNDDTLIAGRALLSFVVLAQLRAVPPVVSRMVAWPPEALRPTIPAVTRLLARLPSEQRRESPEALALHDAAEQLLARLSEEGRIASTFAYADVLELLSTVAQKSNIRVTVTRILGAYEVSDPVVKAGAVAGMRILGAEMVDFISEAVRTPAGMHLLRAALSLQPRPA